MKTFKMYLYLCVVMLYPISLCAQSGTGMTTGMLFPNYLPGMITYSDGYKAKASFNYNVIQEQMWFLDLDSMVMLVGRPSQVAILTAGDHHFVPSSKDAFFEKITAGKGEYYIQWKSVMISQGKNAGYGSTSSTSAISNVGFLDGEDGLRHKLKSSEKFEAKASNAFYIKNDEEKFVKFYSAKTLGNIFKSHKADIEAYAKKESINFNKTEDVTRIVEYGYSLGTE